MKRLLIALDPASQDSLVTEDLVRSGLPIELEAAVVTVADVWLPENPTGDMQGLPSEEPGRLRQAREEARSAIDTAQSSAARAAERLRILFPKWNIHGIACGDSPAWGILKAATEWKANVIVLGSHGRTTLERFFLGSVSQKVAAEATCSVRIARPRLNSHHSRLRIVVAVDGSSDSQAAVAEVARRVWPAYCEFRVVAVVDSRTESALAWGNRQERAPTGHASPEILAQVVEKDAKLLYDSGLSVETQILHGDPKRELLARSEAWEADTIFIGARGLHHGGRLSLGTMASAVTARAHCSVEIVRPA